MLLSYSRSRLKTKLLESDKSVHDKKSRDIAVNYMIACGDLIRVAGASWRPTLAFGRYHQSLAPEFEFIRGTESWNVLYDTVQYRYSTVKYSDVSHCSICRRQSHVLICTTFSQSAFKGMKDA